MNIPKNIKTQSNISDSNSKSGVNVIQLNSNSNLQSRTSKSPEMKNNNENKIKVISGVGANKGINVIPIKNFHAQSDNKNNDKLSPRTSANKVTTGIGNISPRTQQGNKIPQTTKNVHETKIQFDIKNSYKSPSPNRGTNSTSTRYLKKSPEIKK